MATLSAADLQRRHDLEGAPDPFPALTGNDEHTARRPSPGSSTAAPLNTESTEMFPALASAATSGRPTVSNAWSTSTGPRIKAVAVKSKLISDSFTLSSMDLSRAGKNNKPTTLAEVMKNTMSKFKVKVEASTQRKTEKTTFFVKGESEDQVEKAKRFLMSSLSLVTTITVPVPSSTVAAIIGPRGATLKEIRDRTGVRIDIPRKDTLTLNGHTNGASQPATRSVTPLPGPADNEDDGVMVPITINGPSPLVEEARADINYIVATKTAKTVQRVRDIPVHIVPFVLARKAFFESAAEGEELHLSWNEKEREVVVNGDRAAVNRAIDRVKATLEELKSGVQSVSIQLPKRQHRLLVGSGSQEILVKSKCSVVVPKHEDPSEEVKIWGLPTDLSSGLQVVMERANSQHIHEYPLPGPIALSMQLLTYIVRTSFARIITTEHSGVNVYLPSISVAMKQSVLNVDFVGEKLAVDAAVKKLSELIGKLIGGTRDIEIDWLLHRIIQGKGAKRIKQFHDAHNVHVYFPPENAESSTIVLVYDPLSPSASPLLAEKTKHLDEVETELKKLAKDAADVKSEVLTVEKKWHDAVVGQGGTTLNAIIGEDKALAIKFGSEAAKLFGDDSVGEDTVIIRGMSSDVDRAVKEILRIVEEAKNDEIVNSYSVEFDIAKEYIGKIVGAQGSGVNKLRESLGVKLDFTDEMEEKEGKKKKATILKSKVKITGRKENVEEAKRRVLAHVERLADETSEILRIPRQYHASIIGQSGKYVLRLEEKYSVKITFPREAQDSSDTSKTRENLKSDEVLIKGGKKGVAGAKAEILDAVEVEKESNNTLSFTVPARAVARLIGKGGASINEIKDETGAQIDIDKATGSSPAVVNVSVRGTKKAIAAAKTAIMAIADNVSEEVTINLAIESKFHRNLIGTGGQGLRDLIARCGGPSDNKAQAGLVHFPKQGEPADEVRLRGEKILVNKVKVELEKTVAALRDRIILGVVIPAIQHKTMIGRGGQHLNELQARTGAQVQFPGSRTYIQVGEPQNADELSDATQTDIVKVLGPKTAVEKAIAELKKQVRAPAPEAMKEIINVPLKYHHVIGQQGAFFRNLRNIGVSVDQSTLPSKLAVPARPPADVPSARIDDDATENNAVEWKVIMNYQDAEKGDSEWTLKAKDQAALDKAKAEIHKAVEHAEKATHVGFLTLSDRSAFPRIVGAKGANAARLRQETGAEITVSRDENLITIIGSEDALEAAKEAILQISDPKNRNKY